MVNYPFTPDDDYLADLMAEEDKRMGTKSTTLVLLDLLDYIKSQFDLINDRITKLQGQLDEIQDMQREHEADEDMRFGTLYDMEGAVQNIDYQVSDLRDRVDFMLNKTVEGK